MAEQEFTVTFTETEIELVLLGMIELHELWMKNRPPEMHPGQHREIGEHHNSAIKKMKNQYQE